MDSTTRLVPKKNWRQFSLRTLMVAMVVTSIPLGWLSHYVWQAKRQQQAADAIRRLEGTAMMCHLYAEDADEEEGRLTEWLRRCFGDDLFDPINYISLAGCQVTDESLVPLQSLPHVRSLSLRSCAVTDGAVVHLRRLSQLQMIDLSSTGISDARLDQLARLPHLDRVVLKETDGVTQAGIERLQRARPGIGIVR